MVNSLHYGMDRASNPKRRTFQPPCHTINLGLTIMEDSNMKKIQLANNKGVVLVDDSDFEELSKNKWCIHQGKYTAYAKTTVYRDGKKKTIRMHRLIMNAPKGMDVDHRDGNGLYNFRSNLRICTHSQNMMNQRRYAGTSKYKGVSWEKRWGKWEAKIRENGKDHYLGSSSSEIECAKMYDSAALKYFGEFARTNF